MSAKQVKCAFRHPEAKVGNRRQADVPCPITNVWFVRRADLDVDCSEVPLFAVFCVVGITHLAGTFSEESQFASPHVFGGIQLETCGAILPYNQVDALLLFLLYMGYYDTLLPNFIRAAGRMLLSPELRKIMAEGTREIREVNELKRWIAGGRNTFCRPVRKRAGLTWWSNMMASPKPFEPWTHSRPTTCQRYSNEQNGPLSHFGRQSA